MSKKISYLNKNFADYRSHFFYYHKYLTLLKKTYIYK